MNAEGTLKSSRRAVEDYCFLAGREACQHSCSGQTDPRGAPPAERSSLQAEGSDIAPRSPNMRPVPTLADLALNEKAEGPAELPECSSQSCVRNWPLSVEQRPHVRKGSGNKANGPPDFLLQPPQGASQRAADTPPMASSLPNRPNPPGPGRRIFLEEDPYYVTMYHPGSVYVGE